MSISEAREFLSRELFSLGDSSVTVSSIVFFFVILVAFWILAHVIERLVSRWLAHMSVDPGVRFAMSKALRYVVVSAGFVVAFQLVGIDLGRLGIMLGFLSVGIGFGLQNITSNFISGLILLVERPVQVGDRVSVGDTEGDILSINLRSTVVRSLENVAIIIPNSQLIENEVVNWSHGDPRIRLKVPVGVSYGSDLPTVIGALHRVARDHAEVLEEPPPHVRLSEFGDSSWNMELLCWLGDPKSYRDVRSALNMAIVEEFRATGVEIPFPQRDIHMREPGATAAGALTDDPGRA